MLAEVFAELDLLRTKADPYLSEAMEPPACIILLVDVIFLCNTSLMEMKVK
jgi:hypothetical protein